MHGSTLVPWLVRGASTSVDTQVAPPDPDVIDDLRAMMSETVTGGSAKALDDIVGLAGKTGTAQFGDGTHSHGWFIGGYKGVAFAVLVVEGERAYRAVA